MKFAFYLTRRNVEIVMLSSKLMMMLVCGENWEVVDKSFPWAERVDGR